MIDSRKKLSYLNTKYLILNTLLKHSLMSVFIILAVISLLYWQFYNDKQSVQAATGLPKYLNFQGKLNGSNDLPVTNGSYNIRVRIYTDSDSTCTDGTLKWTEERIQANRVAVDNGLFNVLLGGVSTLSLDFNEDNYWLQVSVGGTADTPTPTYENLAPCQRVASAGYAYNADTVDGLHASATATANYLLPLNASADFALPTTSKVQFRDTGLYIQSSADGKLLISSDGVGTDDITVSGSITTDDDITVADDQWLGLGSAAGLIEFDNQATDEVNILNANVGIGTQIPSQKLAVAGTLGIIETGAAPTYYTIIQGGDQAGNVTYTLPTAAPAADGYVLSATAAGVMSWTAAGAGTGDITAVGSMVTGDAFAGDAADDDWLGLGATAGRIEFDDQTTDEINFLKANIGINTSTPSALLDLLYDIPGGTTDNNKVLQIATTGATFNTTSSSLTNYGAYFINTATRSAGANTLTNIALYLAASGADSNYALITNGGNVGIGTTAPTALFSVAEKFLIDSNGNITKINNVAYSWPSSQGGVSTVLTNDGSGNLSWTAPTSSGSSVRGATSNLVVKNNQPDSYTKLLMHMKGTDTSTTFLDSSIGMKTVTANGNAQIDTGASKFDGASALFDGSGDYLSLADDAGWTIGTGEFSIDFWVRFIDVTTVQQAIFSANSGDSLEFQWQGAASNRWQVIKNGTTAYNYSDSISNDTWYHIAIVRESSGAIKVYRNGTSLGSNTDAWSIDMNGVRIGQNAGGSYSMNGWLDEFRISNSIARWTENFTAPASEHDGYPQYKVDVDADSVVMYNGTNTLEARDVNVTADVSASGANGLDSGSEASNTWYYLWVINNGTTTAGLLSTSSTAPTMPSGYTYKKLVSAVRNDASSNLLGFNHIGDQYQYIYPTKVVDDGGSTTTTSLNLSAVVPKSIAKGIYGKVLTNATYAVMINPITFANSLAGDNNTVLYNFRPGGSGVLTVWFLNLLVEEQTIYYQAESGTVDIWVSGFTTR